MSTAATQMPKEVPLIMIGDCGLPYNNLKLHANRMPLLTLYNSPSVVDGFQILINKGRGILAIRIDEKQELVDYAKTFQLSLKQLNISFIKVIIFSTRSEILTSRALIQFPFIRTLNPIHDIKKMITIFSGESQNILDKNKLRGSSPQNFQRPQNLVIVKGKNSAQNPGPAIFQDRVLNRGHKIISNNEKKSSELQIVKNENAANKENRDKLIESCVGPQIISYLYDPELSWRIKGFLKNYDDESSSVEFVINEKDATTLLHEAISNEITHFFCSSSTDEARVCTSLDLIKAEGSKFLFKIPEQVQEVQRRSNRRVAISEQYPALIQYYDSSTHTQRTLNVLNISTGGLGLRVDIDYIKQYPIHKRLKDVTLIFFNRSIKIPEIEIRHNSRSEKLPSFRIVGVQFMDISPREVEFIEMFVVSQYENQQNSSE